MDVQLGQNIYCGPAVLSIFTGCNTDDCAEEIGKINGQFKVKGVYPDTLMKAGNAMGLEFQENQAFIGRSIFWAASVLTKMQPAMYLVTIPKHYIALEVRDQSIYICDNHTKSEIDLQNSARLSQKIERVWKVVKVREFSKPHPIKHQFHAELFNNEAIIKKVITMSDGGIKVQPLGSFKVTNPEELGEVAYEIMKLTGKDKE